jgi:hypothetical protein
MWPRLNDAQWRPLLENKWLAQWCEPGGIGIEARGREPLGEVPTQPRWCTLSRRARMRDVTFRT